MLTIALALTGCAHSPDSDQSLNQAFNQTPKWNKYFIAGSRIPRTLDAQGQPLTGSHVVTITDQDLQSASGVLLGDKLSGGYPR
ncbi:hypothetical protein [Steroidobacter sp.]|uniref:hypothetical protein n=1 Tax=Steroidobacter sp. TaxID=1978227 RepID=UPI001A5EA924|nr:hypothetical protein [Steroidobacter sp.]MBL8271357.1 hypothetical protein [Steroidobacter sp.]